MTLLITFILLYGLILALQVLSTKDYKDEREEYIIAFTEDRGYEPNKKFLAACQVLFVIYVMVFWAPTLTYILFKERERA